MYLRIDCFLPYLSLYGRKQPVLISPSCTTYNTSEWQLKEKNRNQLKNLVLVYLMGSYNFIFSHWSWSFEHHIQIWHAYHIFISEFHDVKIRISLNCSKVSLSIAALNQAMYKNRVENGNFVEIPFIFILWIQQKMEYSESSIIGTSINVILTIPGLIKHSI